MISYYDQHAEVGKDYVGKVKKLLEIGCIVEILPNVEALVHISQLDIGRVPQVAGFVSLGEEMKVKVIEINGDRIRASRRAVLLEEQGHPWNPEETSRPARSSEGREGREGRGGKPRSGGPRGGHRDRR